MAIKTPNGTIYENDIEEWMYKNPDKLWVDGWIDRQLTLVDGERLDLLGYFTFAEGKHIAIELCEIKSVSIKPHHLAQIEGYEFWLRETIRQLGLIELYIHKTLIVTSRDIDKRLLSSANNSGIAIRQATYDGDIHISSPLCFTDRFYKRISTHKDYIIRSGRFDNLINFMLPYMPDFVQDEYQLSEVGK